MRGAAWLVLRTRGPARRSVAGASAHGAGRAASSVLTADPAGHLAVRKANGRSFLVPSAKTLWEDARPPPGVLRDPHAAAARSQQRRSGAQCVPGDSEVPRREQRGPGSSGPQGSVRVWGRGWPWKKLTLVRRGDTARSHGGRRAKMSGERSRGQRGRRGAALFGEGGRARGVRGGGVPGLL